MRKIFLGLSLLIPIAGFSQDRQFQVLSNTNIFGKSLIDSSVIKGTEYFFPDKIHKTFSDTVTGFLTVQVRGISKDGKYTGNIFQYDLINKKLLWGKNIAYSSSIFPQFSNRIIYSADNKSYGVDRNSGNDLWNTKNNIYFVDPVNNIGVGYRFKGLTGNTNNLEGIDLRNGKVIWERELNREYGWNEVFYTNDSTVIVAAAGLHSINLNTGKGWDYNTVTGEPDDKTAAINTLGLMSGILTGAYFYSNGPDVVWNLVSNAIVDSSFIYFSSKEQLVKIDMQSGAIAWKVPFPKDLAGKSSILMNDSVIFMVNNGLAYLGNKQLNFGKPFFAAFDRQTGKQLFFSLVFVKDDPILSFKKYDNEIYLVFKNRIMKYSMKTGNRLAEKEFPKISFGELKYFVDDQVFITNQNGDMVTLQQSDSTKVFVFTNKNKTLSIDNQLNLTNTIEYDDLGICFLATKEYKFITKNEKTLVINNDAKRIAEIDFTSDSFLFENTLYDKQDKRLMAIDLDEIIKNE